jgi:hypothetical protein
MAENKTAKTPTDSGVGFIDGVWHGPTAWQCQCGKPYTVTCISSKPAKREWVGLTDEEIFSILENLQTIYNRPPTEDSRIIFAKTVEQALKEKNHG